MNIFESLTEYLRSSKSELEKVSWPSRQVTLRYSGLVLSVSIIVAAFFATLDFGLGRVVDAALQAKVGAATPAAQTTDPSAVPSLTPTDNTQTNPSGVPGLDIKTDGSNQIQVGDIKTVDPTPVKP